jgi:outer membrane protein assembly factor BamD (BamD/ComL family)
LTRKGKKLTKKDLKEDEFAEFVGESVLYVKHHSRRIMGLLIVAIVIAVGVTFVIKQRRAAEIEAQTILSRGNFDLRQTNYAAALRTYAGIRQRYRGTWSAADATFFSANAYFASARYDSAMAFYNEYLNQGKRRDELTVSAKAGIAQSLEEQARYEEAANNFLRTQQEHPGDVLARDMLLGAARCFRLAGNLDRAIEVYDNLMELYPDSREAELARMQVLELEVRAKRGS